MTYAEKLKDPRWQRKRLEILNRDKWTCQLCGTTEITLHVHHKSYGNNPWESNNKNLITLCEHCHAVEEYYKNEKFNSTVVKVLKEETDGYYILYVLSKNQDGKRFAIFVFEFNKITKDLEFMSLMFYEILDAINKELRNQRKKIRS